MRARGNPSRQRGRKPDRPRRGARYVAWRALRAFAVDHETRVDAEVESSGLPPRDQALATEIARGAVRRQRLLDYVLEGFCARGLPDDPGLLATLRVGAYQLLFLERVPDHAAVDESVALAGPNERGFVNAVLRRVATSVRPRAANPALPRTEIGLVGGRCVVLQRELPDPGSDLAGWLTVVSGLPVFLLQRWRSDHGDDGARALAAAANRTPAVHLRAVGISRAELAAELTQASVGVVEAEHPRLLRWIGGASPFATRAFAEGRFVVQDPTAVRAAEAVGAQPGETVLDLCAAPGTKATLLAEAVGPTGRVWAHDTDPKRRGKIIENVMRLGMPWIKIVEDLDARAPFDRVLVDVPCSNTGVLSRRVEVRHRLRPETIESLASLQRELLGRGADLVGDGGTIVYSTCSIEPEEGDGVVAAVVGSRSDLEIAGSTRTLPDPPEHDGGYHAVLRRRVPEAVGSG